MWESFHYITVHVAACSVLRMPCFINKGFRFFKNFSPAFSCVQHLIFKYAHMQNKRILCCVLSRMGQNIKIHSRQ